MQENEADREARLREIASKLFFTRWPFLTGRSMTVILPHRTQGGGGGENDSGGGEGGSDMRNRSLSGEINASYGSAGCEVVP